MNAQGFLGLCCIKRGKTFTKSGEQTQRKHPVYFGNLGGMRGAASFSTKRGEPKGKFFGTGQKMCRTEWGKTLHWVNGYFIREKPFHFQNEPKKQKIG